MVVGETIFGWALKETLKWAKEMLNDALHRAALLAEEKKETTEEVGRIIDKEMKLLQHKIDLLREIEKLIEEEGEAENATKLLEVHIAQWQQHLEEVDQVINNLNIARNQHMKKWRKDKDFLKHIDQEIEKLRLRKEQLLKNLEELHSQLRKLQKDTYRKKKEEAKDKEKVDRLEFEEEETDRKKRAVERSF